MIKKLLYRIKNLIYFLIDNSKPKNTGATLVITKGRIVSKGKESYYNGKFTVKGSSGTLEVGSYCAIGEDVKVILSNHDMSKTCMQYTFYRKNFNINPASNKSLTTVIENDVWIGDNVIILPGITIGTGAVLAAGAIVTKNVEPYTIVGGNPAKPIKKRFSEEKIKELLDSKWWEWSEEKIKENSSFFGI